MNLTVIDKKMRMQYGLSSETLYTSALLIPIPYIDMALNNLHNGGQVPLFPPQTLLTSPIASFPNSVATAEQAESSTTPELVFVSYPTAAEPNIEEQESNSPSRDSGSTSSEAGNREPGEQELETLLDLWMVAKLREASTSLASLISNLYPNQFLPSATRPSVSTASEGWRDAPARIRSWVTNRACSWLDICSQSTHAQLDNHLSSQDTLNRPWAEGKSNPSEWAEDGRVLSEIPSYVLEHAPYVHLFSKEKYWPSDIAAHLNHITPKLNYTPMLPSSEHPTLTNLDELNQWEQGLNVYLTSNEDVETNPDWLESRINIPQPLPGDDGNKSPRTESGYLFDDADVREHDEASEAAPPGGDTGVDADAENSSGWPRKRPPRREPGRSEAPAVLIVVEKGEGIVDAFWFYFYSFNQGNQVLNVRFGSHVGDWEHTLVRFENGTPTTVFCSEHSFGEAFTYNAAEKIGKRPVVYSATGTHAMYSSPGVHDYILPFGLLHDETDRGPLWDPALNNLAYTYDYQEDLLLASTLNPQAPLSWFYFAGKWGDKMYPLSDKRQYTFAGQYHYVSGPLGPRFKNLGRKNVCQGDEDPCLVKRIIGGDTFSWRWDSIGEGEEMSDEDYQRFFGNDPSQDVPSSSWEN